MPSNELRHNQESQRPKINRENTGGKKTTELRLTLRCKKRVLDDSVSIMKERSAKAKAEP